MLYCKNLPFQFENRIYMKLPCMMNVVLRLNVHVRRHVWCYGAWESSLVLLMSQALLGFRLNLASISWSCLYLYQNLSGSSQWEHQKWNNSLLIGLWSVGHWGNTSVDRWDVLFSAICHQGHTYSTVGKWLGVWASRFSQIPTLWLMISICNICKI